ncbi:hypothetical protein [Absidia glauca]|uniref:GDP/GTP exchange factor Sec2 N-terminal domain-containing protein n=1 Tax=Absidia glauca TaxID=4829 RepID=A0A168R279_ABSGL|nr:hypothetical protein [Absidia glauca]
MTTEEVVLAIQPLDHQHPKDITTLFNQLQDNVDQAHHQARLSDSSASTLSISSSSTTNSMHQVQHKRQQLFHCDKPPLPPPHQSTALSSINNTNGTDSALPSTVLPATTCPCHHWLVSMDSEHCAICATPVEVMISLQHERNERRKQLRTYRRQWMDMSAIQNQQQNDMMRLQRTILEHRETIMVREEDMASLQQDMIQLHTKYHDEGAQIKSIELAKQAAKREIEDLGQHLFKEAQDMVAIEQQEKAVLEESCGDLKAQLERTQVDLDGVMTQLRTLRMDMGRWGDHQDEQQMMSTNTASSAFNNSSMISDNDTNDVGNTDSGRSSTTTASSISTPALSSSSSPITTATSQKFLIRAKMDLAALQTGGGHYNNLYLETFEDDQLLLDFQEFMESATSTSFSLKRLHGLPFIKVCLADDIEPCLRFGPSPKVTNSKRILEAIQIKTCFVEKCPPGFVREQAALLRKERLAKKNKPSLWVKFAASVDSTTTYDTTTNTTTNTSSKGSSLTGTDSSHYMSCATCGRRVLDNEDDSAIMENELAYRYRISYFDEWACIDRHCADRLTSVISFYTFLRNLRLGDYKGRSLMDIYQECSRLRLLMFLSRLGALPPSST